MTPSHGVFGTGLIVGLLWGVWHLPVNYWGINSSSGGLPLAVVLPAFLFTFLPPYRMLMVWVYDRTGGSLPVVILMHASLIGFWSTFTPVGIAGVPLVTWYLTWAVLLWVVVAAVAVANRGRLPRQSLHR
jgi:CAAX protease family protein